MGAHARLEGPEQTPGRPDWMRPRRAGLLLLESLAIIAGYVLLGWVDSASPSLADWSPSGQRRAMPLRYCC